MMHHHHYGEAEVGKVFDWKIVTRLFKLMRPYLKYLLAATFFLIIAAGVEMSYPYITKIAIDDYIIKNGRKVTGVHGQSGFIKIDDDSYFASQKDLERVDMGVLRRWEKEKRVSSERYYYTFVDRLDEKAVSVVASHPELFEQYDSLIIISYSDLKKLKHSEASLVRKNDFSGVVRIVLIFLVIVLFGGIANYSQIYLSQLAGQFFMHSLRVKIFKKLQSLDLRFFDRNPVGRLVTRATNDVQAVNEAFTQIFARLLKDFLLLVGIVAIMLSMNLRLALIAFTVIPFLLLITFYFRLRARSIYRKVRVKLARLNAALQENLSGIRIIKIFNKEKDNLRRFDEINEDYLKINLKQVLLMSYFRPVIEIISSLGIGIVLYYGGGQVIAGKISLGILVAFISYVEMFFRPIRQLTESYTLLQSAMASSERIFLLLDEESRIKSAQNPVELKKLRGEIEFKNVWFKYDKEWVLKDVSFKVLPGEHVAIVGSTGAGKTSIINLISRLYEINKGSILIDGIDIKKIDLAPLRSRIGVVPQDVSLFA
ncbi:MAG TPA: ABC transporter ATP-binding protein, partial [candidate division WOR-3 bacterium]|nr:ABC transporter ATP-binding protein [candidate division WOR-3 bacterium]